MEFWFESLYFTIYESRQSYSMIYVKGNDMSAFPVNSRACELLAESSIKEKYPY